MKITMAFGIRPRQALINIAVWLLIILFIVGFYLYQRPIPDANVDLEPIASLKSETVSLPWPNYGQGAISEKTLGPLATYGEQKPVPMASTAKIVTALAVIKQRPFKPGEQGPMITLTADDVAILNDYNSKGGSAIRVVAGEQISEYQALEALLIPSANNLADSLARWAFGSMENYVSYANSMISTMGLTKTHITGASGFSEDSVSTAEELTRLGSALIESPVLSEIVGKKATNLPVAGEVQNYNWLLGNNGVVGIKTGDTDAAGGCFVFAANHEVVGKKMTFVGAIMAAPNRNQAITDSRTILAAIDQGFSERTALKKDRVLGTYNTSWGTSAKVVAAGDLKAITWRGWQLEVGEKAQSIKAPASAGAKVGEVSLKLGQSSVSSPLVLQENLAGPAWTWRLFR